MCPGIKTVVRTARLDNGRDQHQRLGAEREILRRLIVDRRPRNASCSPCSMHQSLRKSRSAANPGECRRGEQVERVILIPLLALTGGVDHPQACRLLKVDRPVLSLWRIFSGQTQYEFPSSMNVLYSELVGDPQRRMAQATRCRGDLALIVASDYLVHAAGALAALDSESKISPSSSPRGTSPGS